MNWGKGNREEEKTGKRLCGDVNRPWGRRRGRDVVWAGDGGRGWGGVGIQANEGKEDQRSQSRSERNWGWR